MLGERHYCLLNGHCTMHVLTTVPCADRPPIRVCPQALSFANAGHRQLALVLRTRHHRRIITATRPRLSPLQPAQWPLSAGVISISRPRGRHRHRRASSAPILLLFSPALRKWPRWTPGRAGGECCAHSPGQKQPRRRPWAAVVIVGRVEEKSRRALGAIGVHATRSSPRSSCSCRCGCY